MSRMPLPEEEIVVSVQGSYGVFDVVWDGRTTNCRSCGDEIGFGVTKKGKKMPIDIPSDDGSPTTSHFATCDSADQFRKKR